MGCMTPPLIVSQVIKPVRYSDIIVSIMIGVVFLPSKSDITLIAVVIISGPIPSDSIPLLTILMSVHTWL